MWQFEYWQYKYLFVQEVAKIIVACHIQQLINPITCLYTGVAISIKLRSGNYY